MAQQPGRNTVGGPREHRQETPQPGGTAHGVEDHRHDDALCLEDPTGTDRNLDQAEGPEVPPRMFGGGLLRERVWLRLHRRDRSMRL